jgi:pyruvate dehydrogenase (quinone)
MRMPDTVHSGRTARLAVLPIPPAISAKMARAFMSYMVKAVVDGRGDDLVDLARSNLWA